MPGVVAVTLGGSRALGTHRPDSDTDLGVYFRGTLAVGALRALAHDISDEARYRSVDAAATLAADVRAAVT